MSIPKCIYNGRKECLQRGNCSGCHIQPLPGEFEAGDMVETEEEALVPNSFGIVTGLATDDYPETTTEYIVDFGDQTCTVANFDMHHVSIMDMTDAKYHEKSREDALAVFTDYAKDRIKTMLSYPTEAFELRQLEKAAGEMALIRCLVRDLGILTEEENDVWYTKLCMEVGNNVQKDPV